MLKCAHTQHGMRGLLRSILGHFQCHSVVCSKFLRLEMGCHNLPIDTAAWAGISSLQSTCNMYQHRPDGLKKYLMLEYPALQALHDKRPNQDCMHSRVLP